MARVDMKQSAADQKETMGVVGPSKREEYPYGLRIRLGEAEMKKLGMDDLPEVGDEIELDAKVKVVSTNASASESSKNRSVELQITHMELGGEEEESAEDKAKKLYPGDGKGLPADAIR